MNTDGKNRMARPQYIRAQLVGQASSLTVRAASVPPVPPAGVRHCGIGNTGLGCPVNRQARMPAPQARGGCLTLRQKRRCAQFIQRELWSAVLIRVHPCPSVVSRFPLLFNRCESSCRDRSNTKRVRLPRPVRHERGEGWGEGCFTFSNRLASRRASSPRPSPPFRTEERETEAPVRTAAVFATTDTTV